MEPTTGPLLKGFFSFQAIANLNKSNKGALKVDGFIPVFKLTHNVIKSFLQKTFHLSGLIILGKR